MDIPLKIVRTFPTNMDVVRFEIKHSASSSVMSVLAIRIDKIVNISSQQTINSLHT